MEVCIDNLESAINAEKGGAMKLELCSTNNDGGLTPSLGLLRVVKKNVKIPVIVMIRPRTGDYIYSDEEIEIMSEDVKIYGENGADGFVFGIITPEGKVDVKNCSKLIKLAGNLPVTFSRAFDVIKDPLERMEEIISLGFERILTSGLQESACEGIPLLKQLMEAARGRIVIMPGAGIKPNNLQFLLKETNAVQFHASAGKVLKKEHMVTDQSIVKEMVTIFNSMSKCKK
ncbi:copper homeostasis protein cutC homolog isoform X1 [Halyomorpha halys]|uniref:copper homeostasis protein cutC homolog isoform X1 n=1 Tax=Halyomorpha halys TaxID=286706 RepID=UPI0006D4D214|nr:copper homeostasis protein cutC homolog isoform X1 [Halyomorpha halys]XP_014281690.1 copper homeostasis protein cutC homolog isoform X1 [Halyomorpha halys]